MYVAERRKQPQPRDRIWGARLRAIRKERLGLSIDPAADRAGWKTSKLSYTERGLRKITTQDISVLLTAWELPPAERDALLEEFANAGSSGLWDRPIPGVPNDVGTLAQYEAQATAMATVATAAVPGLLQTYETAVAILAADGAPTEDIGRRWMAREQRQRVLAKVDYTAYITEQALRTQWGGVKVWRDQLRHLLAREQIGVVIRVIPAGQTDVLLLHSWHFMWLRNAPSVVQVELIDGATYAHEADRYARTLERLDRVALLRDRSRTLISELTEGL